LNQQILYCIENQKEGLDYGKHNFIFNENLGLWGCEFCFLPKEKANFKPMRKNEDGKFHFVEICSMLGCDNPVQTEYQCVIKVCKECYQDGNEDWDWSKN